MRGLGDGARGMVVFKHLEGCVSKWASPERPDYRDQAWEVRFTAWALGGAVVKEVPGTPAVCPPYMALALTVSKGNTGMVWHLKCLQASSGPLNHQQHPPTLHS